MTTTSSPNTSHVQDIFNFLCKAASDCCTVTYEDVGKEVGLPPYGLSNYLEAVFRVCQDRRLPWLNALVVRKDNHRPGEGFQGTFNHGAELIDGELVWRMAVAQVMAYPGWATVTY
jgi:hypothetical protein